jgi:large subunit ribosomal protein L17
MVPKLFGPIRERYASRPGGYTRVLRVEPLKEDQAESAILELVDGPRDLRFAMTAKTLANTPKTKQFNQRTAENVRKVTRFRENGVETLQAMVERMRIAKEKGIDNRVLPAPQKVYPEEKAKRQMHYFEETDNYRLPNKIVRLPFQPKDGKAWGTNKKAAYKKKFGITVKSRVESGSEGHTAKSREGHAAEGREEHTAKSTGGVALTR